jgi:hypothetical protein
MEGYMQKNMLALMIIFLFSSACSKDSATTTTASSSSVVSFPTSFAVSSPTIGASSFASLEDESILAFTADTVSASDSIASKVEKIDAIVEADTAAECAVSLSIASSTNASCYGPTLTYTGHPDGAPTGGNLPGGDLGIWSATGTGGEACAASQLNARMRGVSSYVDLGLFTMASVVCALNNNSQALPAAGANVDLTSLMSGKLTINGSAATVTAASISRSSTDSGGQPVYTTSITATQNSNLTYDIRLKHIPLETSNATYKGKVSVKVSNSTGTRDGNCQDSASQGTNEATSVSYEKSSSTNVRVMLKSAGFCTASADPYASATDFTVDLSKVSSGGVPSGWGGNGNYVLAEYNPEAGTGTYFYAWQAGKGDGNTRVFNSIISGTSGSRTGTSFFGFGTAITGTSFAGKIDRMICNWAGPGNSHTGVSKVQKQVMSESSGVFAPTSSFITYDPTNTCESNSNTFSITANSITTTADLTTSNLVDLSTVSTSISTDPTVPTNVDL